MNTDVEDFYFFGHGHDYRGALMDFIQLSGMPFLPSPYNLSSFLSPSCYHFHRSYHDGASLRVRHLVVSMVEHQQL